MASANLQAWPTFNLKDPVDVLIKLSHYYGSDPSIVLAGGGNTSAKLDDGRVLLVKGSGHALATIPAEGFVEMDRMKLLAILDEPMADDFTKREARFTQLTTACRNMPEKGQRPSVECLLHAIVPGTFVVHSHATLANMLSCSSDGEKIANELFGDDVLWIPYSTGWELAQKMHDCLTEYSARTGRDCPVAFLMQNHGLAVSGETPDELREKTDKILGAIEKYLTKFASDQPFGKICKVSDEDKKARKLIDVIAPALRGLLTDDPSKLPIVTFDDGELAISIAAGSEGKAVALGGALIPDQVVYCKSLPTWFDPAGLEDEDKIIEALGEVVEKYRQRSGYAPIVVLVAGLGMFTAGKNFAAALTAGNVYRDAIEVMSRVVKVGGIKYLSAAESTELEGWELENYRRKFSVSAGQATGRADGKIVVVTGGAQGFGLEIAQDFAAQGSHVVLADINAQGASAAADGIVTELNKSRAMGLAMNVANGESVANALHEVVRTYGGCDTFVSNAGVLRAESVKSQSEKDFDFVTDVNYKGFFVCVQKVSAVMVIQHKACPDCWSDIVQINSKSGLIGSNRNGAYAGSKFGGIGLMQSFAMELIEDGIKVNSICPGNFFDGPLWSDPNNGLFVQYLRTGKIPGAKTIEDVRKGYEAKVPMGRGCLTADVMKAVYYIMEQKYETGQAIPVTGGQVMLK